MSVSIFHMTDAIVLQGDARAAQEIGAMSKEINSLTVSSLSVKQFLTVTMLVIISLTVSTLV